MPLRGIRIQIKQIINLQKLRYYSMANYGIAPEELLLAPNRVNDKEIQEQKDAHEWWDKLRSKKALRGQNRGLTITEIYIKTILKK